MLARFGIHNQLSLSSSHFNFNRGYSQFVYKEGLKFKKTQKKKLLKEKKARRLAKKKEFTLQDLIEYQQRKVVTPPSSLTVPIISFKTGEETGETVTLPADTFASPVRPDILHRYVVWHRANLRQGTSKTKSRSEVRGSTRKLFRQKGSGRARRGSIRSPLLVGGGHTFAKKPKDWSFPLPKKVRRLALRSALSAKFSQGKIIIVDDFDFVPQLRPSSAGKSTEELTGRDFMYAGPIVKLFRKIGWTNVLLVDHIPSRKELFLATRNTKWIGLTTKELLNVYDILLRDKLIISVQSIDLLCARSDPHRKLPAPAPKSEEEKTEEKRELEMEIEN